MGGGHKPMGCDGPGMSAFLAGLFTGTFSSITIKVRERRILPTYLPSLRLPSLPNHHSAATYVCRV